MLVSISAWAPLATDQTLNLLSFGLAANPDPVRPPANGRPDTPDPKTSVVSDCVEAVTECEAVSECKPIVAIPVTEREAAVIAIPVAERRPIIPIPVTERRTIAIPVTGCEAVIAVAVAERAIGLSMGRA